jgi:hypothetical protein
MEKDENEGCRGGRLGRGFTGKGDLLEGEYRYFREDLLYHRAIYTWSVWTLSSEYDDDVIDPHFSVSMTTIERKTGR